MNLQQIQCIRRREVGLRNPLLTISRLYRGQPEAPNPVSENRFLFKICSLSVAAILVCGTLLLLTTLSNPSPEAAAPASADLPEQTGSITEAEQGREAESLAETSAQAPAESDSIFTASITASTVPGTAAPEATVSTQYESANAATDEDTSPIAGTKASEPASVAADSDEPSGEIASPSADAEAPQEPVVAAEAEQAPQAPPLPERAPSKATAQQTVVAADIPQRKPAAKPHWQPMTVGTPAEPAVSDAKPAARSTAPKMSAGSYRAKVWAALARHKPRLGRPGSATVTFAIGTNGNLRSARVSRSSGNAGLDRRALATVRAAAPFPQPPGNLNGGALAYSIQIYFR